MTNVSFNKVKPSRVEEVEIERFDEDQFVSLLNKGNIKVLIPYRYRQQVLFVMNKYRSGHYTFNHSQNINNFLVQFR